MNIIAPGYSAVNLNIKREQKSGNPKFGMRSQSGGATPGPSRLGRAVPTVSLDDDSEVRVLRSLLSLDPGNRSNERDFDGQLEDVRRERRADRSGHPLFAPSVPTSTRPAPPGIPTHSRPQPVLQDREVGVERQPQRNIEGGVLDRPELPRVNDGARGPSFYVDRMYSPGRSHSPRIDDGRGEIFNTDPGFNKRFSASGEVRNLLRTFQERADQPVLVRSDNRSQTGFLRVLKQGLE